MQSAGADTLSKIKFGLINDYFHSNAVRVNGKGLSPKIKKFLKDCIPLDEECRRIRFLIPAAPAGRKNIQYITEEESKAFCHALLDKNNRLTYKARALGTILYYTGLRSVDIANLKLDSINLQERTIILVQSKTSTPLTLPLLPVIGNAIYDYCVLERPSTDSQYLFVGNTAPHHKVGTGAVTIAVNTVMAVAGIRLEKEDRKGTHIFRHRAATTMMENNIPPAVISRTLGHSSPDSLDPYLYADKVHLKECALSLASFPLTKEVFAHV
jgi:integrase